MSSANIQLDQHGQLHHLLTTEGLPQSLIVQILDTAESFLNVNDKGSKKVPLLRGKTIINLFFEPSTRTRTTFELAAKRLSADVLNININTSSTTKGESLLDTLHTLQAMQCDMFVVRHQQSGAAHFIAQQVAPHVSVINAGDGSHAHPTQALLDMFTIRKHKGDFSKLRVAIVGDVQHSRVARSQIHALNALNTAEVRVIAPRTLIPNQLDKLGVHIYQNIEQGLRNVDVIMVLRLQRERMQGAALPSASEYFASFGLDQRRLGLAKSDALVMHPGPANRGVEIASDIADGPQSVITEQVTNGIAVRMAVIAMAMSSEQRTQVTG